MKSRATRRQAPRQSSDEPDEVLRLARLASAHSDSRENLAGLSFRKELQNDHVGPFEGRCGAVAVAQGEEEHELMCDTAIVALCLAKAASIEGAIVKVFAAFGLLLQEEESPHDGYWHRRHMGLARLLIDDAQRVIEDHHGPVAKLVPDCWWSDHWSPSARMRRAALVDEKLSGVTS